MSARNLGPRAGLTGILLCSCLLVSVLAACGISYGSEDTSTEVFKGITVGGELVTGRNVTFQVQYEQPYPAPVQVLCALVAKEGQDHQPSPPATSTPDPSIPPTPPGIPPAPATPRHKVLDLLDEEIPANHSVTAEPATPEELLFKPGSRDNPITPVAGTLEGQFTAPGEPGLYGIRCYTPADTNNTFTKTIRIAAP